MGNWGKLKTSRMYDHLYVQEGAKSQLLLIVHLGCGDFVLLNDAGVPAAMPLVEPESLQLSL